uniref:Slit homolog 3 protein-like n=1 Tax=Saccoglossus kowalevskii TaxID=10224 RepID=A0ABM0N038_SACKO|nr:PREDICTED: slit homolog 3 protein-like [Saccoglossus kowalevskii]
MTQHFLGFLKLKYTLCSTNPCLNGGLCEEDVNINAGYLCQCFGGYTGLNCEIGSPCGSQPCLNGGSCFDIPDLPTGYLCQCLDQYSGSNCELNNPCGVQPCQNGGSCIINTELPSGYYCDCMLGYSGINCAQGNACVTQPCLNGGECINDPAEVGGYQIPVEHNLVKMVAYATKILTKRLVIPVNARMALLEQIVPWLIHAVRCHAKMGDSASLQRLYLGNISVSVHRNIRAPIANKRIRVATDLAKMVDNALILRINPRGTFASVLVGLKEEIVNKGTRVVHILVKTMELVTGLPVYKEDISANVHQYIRGPTARNLTHAVANLVRMVEDVTVTRIIQMYTRVNVLAVTLEHSVKSQIRVDRSPACMVVTVLSILASLSDTVVSVKLDIQGRHVISWIPAASNLVRMGATATLYQTNPVHTFASVYRALSGLIATQDPCARELCQNGGQCNSDPTLLDGFYCVCPLGYSGTYCENSFLTCPDYLNMVCENGGVCFMNSDMEMGYVCTCPMGFNGYNCEIDLNMCENSGPCERGQCRKTSSGPVCVCPDGWAGDKCEQKLDLCGEGACFNDGRCIVVGEQEVCACSGGYGGSRCDTLVAAGCVHVTSSVMFILFVSIFLLSIFMHNW